MTVPLFFCVPIFFLYLNVLLPNMLVKIFIDIQFHNEHQMTKTKRNEETSSYFSVVCFLQPRFQKENLTFLSKSIEIYIRHGYTKPFPTVYSCYLYWYTYKINYSVEYITELCSIAVYTYQKFNQDNYDRYIAIIIIKYSITSSFQDL